MISYILTKAGYTLLTLLGVLSVIFGLFNILPSDPADMLLGQNESKEQLIIVRKKYGFDLPLHQQYFYYLNDVSPISIHSKNSEDFSFYNKSDYGGVKLINTTNKVVVLKWPYLRKSLQKNGKKVSSIIAETLPNTAVLAVSSILIALFIGMALGIISAVKQDTWMDRFIQITSTLGMSVPSFFSAILFAWLFGFVWHKYTHLPMSGSLYALDDFGEGKQLQLQNLILPAVVLGIRPLAVVTQLMRNSLLEVLQQDYIRTARAKGLSNFTVIYRHGIKNALNPVVTAISGWFASMLAGAVFVEYIFGWNGIGKEVVNALNTSDLPIVMGVVLIIALIFIIINIFVDLIYGWLDPRVKLIS